MSIIAAQSVKGYELLEMIGEGANGAVYRAKQQYVNREVAVKIILPEYASRPDFIRRFENEAQLVAQLEHLHILPLYDYWRDPDGAYLVMRLMKGGSLSDAIETNGELSLQKTALLVDQIASALNAAHQHGVVHRDLKPANILLDESGNAYLSDFGIAKELGGEENLTQTSVILGTPAYISPEQVQGQQVSPQTDIYALGVMIYELVVGEHPFAEASTAELVVKHLNEPIPYVRDRKPDLPAALDGVIQKATAKNPGDRYSSALLLAEDVRRSLELDTGSLQVPIDELYNPYKGLRAFQEYDSDDFFGRDGLTGQLIAQLATPGLNNHFLAVVGPSGSGKSSVVNAGLLPALRKGALPGSDQWFLVEMHPGSQPLVELELALLSISANPDVQFAKLIHQDRHGLGKAVKSALPGEDSQLLLVIDQFEELYSLVQEGSQRNQFLDSLSSAVSDPDGRVRIVITLRADFYDRPLMHPEFGRLVEDRTVVVLPLSLEELESVVRRPTEHVGAVLEQGLVTAITSDISDQPGALPLLEYALTELFEHREGRMLTCEAYQAIGGVLGALGRRAEEVYVALDEAGTTAARQLFMRLVTLGEGAEDTRRRVVRREVTGIHPETMTQVIDDFGKARLLTFDRDPDTREPTVEVAHEALLQEWKRLRSWLDNSRADIRMQRVLANAATEWHATDRNPGYLLRDTRLDQFDAWAATTDMALTDLEADYLDASLAERRARLAQEQKRQAREAAMERRSRNFLRGLVAVLAVATIVAVGLTLFAFNQQGEAQRSAATAQAEAAARATQQLVAESEADQRATQQAVAEEEARARATAEAIAVEERDKVLRQASVALAEQARDQNKFGDPELAVLLTLAALEGYPYTAQAERVLGESVIAIPSVSLSIEGGNVGWSAVDWSPTGDLIASALFGGTLPTGSQILVQDALSGEEIRHFDMDVDCSLSSNVIWSPTGNQLIVVPKFCEFAPRIINTQTGEEIFSLASKPGEANFDAAWSHDGEFILTGSQDGIVRIWDAHSGDRSMSFQAHDNYVTQVAWSPTGEHLATGSIDNTAKIWDSVSRELLHVLEGYQEDVSALSWSPDGSQIAVASLDSSVDLWDAISGEKLSTFVGLSDQVRDVAWSPAGDYIATDSLDGTTRIWDAVSGKQLYDVFQNNLEEGLLSNSIDWSPGGDRVLIMGVDHNQIWDLTELPPILSGHSRGLNKAQWSPDGMLIATGSLDGTTRIWDAANGDLVANLEHLEAVNDITWSPDSSFIALASQDGSIGVWEIATDSFEEIPNPDGYVFNYLAWSPDGSRFVATSETDLVGVIWDVNTGVSTLLHQGDLLCALTTPSWSPEGDRIITGCERRDVRDTPAVIWDVETGEELGRLGGESGNSLVVRWSPDGSSIAVGYSDIEIRIWDAGTGLTTVKYSGHADPIVDLDWSPNSQRIASADYGGNIRVWDAQTGEVVLSDKQNQTITSISWSPAGDYLIASSYDIVPEILPAWQTTEALLAYAEGRCIWRELSVRERERFGLPKQR